MIKKEKNLNKFPENFLWGTATASYQVEGNNKWCDWWAYEIEKDLERSGIACDHYNRFEEDIKIMKELNQNSYRLSLEWSRIQKEKDKFDQAELDHYKRMLKALKDSEITTFVTVHHFTNPIWISQIGGWENKKTIDYYLKFLEKIYSELHEYIDFWLPFNEINTYVGMGYLAGIWPPGKKSPLKGLIVTKNMICANKKAHDYLHSKDNGVKVGIAQAVNFSEKISPLSSLVSKAYEYIGNYYILDKLKGHLDFIGVNYYFRVKVSTWKILKAWATNSSVYDYPKEKVTDLGWEIYPKGLYHVLKKVWHKYKKDIYITENGLADERDSLRKDFIVDHLKEVLGAINENIPVKGYFHWSLLDNFEWAEGYKAKFGLVRIDKDGKRIIKESARFYAKVAGQNYLEPAETKAFSETAK